MRVHHLNCGTDCPLGGALFDGCSIGALGRIVCHCLLIETDAHGLVLVDTGYGLRDVAHPHQHPNPRITLPWRLMLNIRLHGHETAVRQVEALGYLADDVRHIVATHLDFDHAGGLLLRSFGLTWWAPFLLAISASSGLRWQRGRLPR